MSVPEGSQALVMCFSPKISLALAKLLVLIEPQFSSLVKALELITVTGIL